MKFVDEAVIEVVAGKGGSGAVHFAREKHKPKGAPDGGNGGRGGSVIAKANRNVHTLLDFQFQSIWKAEDGRPGESNNKDGRSGKDIIIDVPPGTLITSVENEESAFDLVNDGQECVLAKGGRGGKGNAFFKSSTNQSPEHSQPGEEGEKGQFSVSLKLIADVGIIGFPNAGKSTLISRISAAKPKIADYPFTTLTPNLGLVRSDSGRSFVVADVPGLIPGAHSGKGLGTTFLKHLERTKVLLYVMEPFPCIWDNQEYSPYQAFEALKEEAVLFSKDLGNKRFIVAVSKADTLPLEDLKAISLEFEKLGVPFLTFSSVAGIGLKELVFALEKQLSENQG